MKKLYIQILTVVLFIATSLSSFGQIKRDTRGFQIVNDAEFSVFDTRGEISSGISPPCDCIGCCEIPNFRFTDPTLAALRNHEASQLAAAAEFYAWVNTQYNLMEQEIERQLGKDFSNFNEAQSAFFKSFEVSSVKTESKHLSPKYNSKVNVKQSVRSLCLTEIKKLDLRANEINSGNINNSQYGNLRYKSTPLNEITSLSQLNTFRAQEVNEFSDNQWRLDQELRIQNQLNNELSNLQNLNHDILNKLSDIQKAYFGQAGNDFDKLDHMQQYLVANVYVFQGPVLPPWDKVYSFGSRDYIESYVWKKNPAHLSIFHSDYWQSIVIYPTGPVVAQLEVERLRQEALAQALNEVSTADILADGAIAGLGSRNEDFIKAKPELHNEVNKYFKVNDFSKASSDCVNYLLNQYLDGGQFTLGKNYYPSASTPLLNSPSNPNIALGTSLNSLAIQDEFTYFNNVLAALFDNSVLRPEYQGQIIREVLTANGITIPFGLDNATLSNYFNFVPTGNNNIRIDHAGGHGNKANLDQYLKDLKDFHNGVQDLLSNPPPIGSSAFAYIDYENKIAEVLEFTNDSDALAVAELFKTEAARDAFLSLAHHNAIAHCGRNILEAGITNQLEFRNLDAEGLEIIAKESAQVAAIEDIAEELDQNSSFWPQNSEEWGAFVDIMAPLIGELVIGFIPGSDAIELFRAINNNDALGASIAMAGLIVDVAGLSAIKGAIKGVKIFRKAIKIGRKLGAVLKAAGKAAKKGFKTTLDAAGNLILKKGDEIIAQGDGPVKDYLVDLARKVSSAVNNKLASALSSGVKKNLDDAIARGDFLPEIVEDSVEEIVEATAKKGSKLSWPEVKALFKRGNDFNAKARSKYQYNEIHLGSNGKRLDSYIPGKEIISRKATDLAKIKTATFEKYLKELTTKYKKGFSIRSNKYSKPPFNIDGQVLSGDYFLEIPLSNKAFYEASITLQNLARQYGVKIKYLAE